MYAKENQMIEIILLALSSYAVTFLAAVSFVGGKVWRDPLCNAVDRTFGAYSAFSESVAYFVECRMCTGFWVSLGVVLIAGEPWQFLPVYGLSYFLATQERD